MKFQKKHHQAPSTDLFLIPLTSEVVAEVTLKPKSIIHEPCSRLVADESVQVWRKIIATTHNLCYSSQQHTFPSRKSNDL
jgi:hypothetical protein